MSLRLLMAGLGVLLCSLPAAAERPAAKLPPRAAQALARVAIQHNGRVKTLDSFARETLEQITGQPRVGAASGLETVAAIMADADAWQQVPLVAVPFRPLREPLGMDAHAAHIAYNDLVASRKLMRLLPAIVAKQERSEKLSIQENETMDAFQRFVTLSHLFEHQLALVPPAQGGPEQSWLPLLEPSRAVTPGQEALRQAWETLMQALRAGQAEAISQAAEALRAQQAALNPAAYPAAWRLELELWYNRLDLFRLAWLLYLAAAVLLGASLNAPRSAMGPAGFAAAGLAFVLHTAGIVTRVVLGGRPPVSNFFETMLWLPYVGVIVAGCLEARYRARYLGLAAALLAGICLLLTEHVPLDSSITPVVAVLRSNKWLTIHVLTIVASYGALALATVLAHVYGVLYLPRRKKPHPALPALNLLLYRVIQVGVVLLAGGIMLGAVWANASWGRYWGWDPKETWALITLLWFVAVLHGRFAGWIHGVGISLATIGGFLLLLMTYYGVSFYLVGLHSYAGGHAKPLPALLVGYLIVETAFVVLVGVRALQRPARRIA